MNVHLDNFVSRYAKILTQRVNLEVIAGEHRRKHSRTPFLVVDGLSVLKPIFSNLPLRHCGGQWCEYVRRMKAFVNSMKSIGIEMVFYFDSSFKEVTQEEVESRNRGAGVKMAELFQLYRKETSLEHLRPLLPGEPYFFRYLLKYECECIVRIALTDLHREVAFWAKDIPECFGILANDAEYMLFETKPLILARSLNLRTLTSSICLRKEFLRVTGLESGHFPLLGCMLGNSIVPAELLRNFHNRLSPRYGCKDKTLVERAVGMIRQFGWLSCLSGDLVNDVAEVMFIDAELLKSGIYYYNLTRRTLLTEDTTYGSLETSNVLRERCFFCQLPSTIFTLYSHRKARYGISVEDPYDEGMPASATIFRPVRQRIYTIMFGGSDVQIKEWCVYKNKNCLEPGIVQCVPTVIGEDVPTMEQLLSGSINSDICWKLFAKCLGISIPVGDLLKVKTHLIAICCVLNILIQCATLQIQEWEVKSFICQAILPQAKDIEYVTRIEVEIDPRAASLLGIVLRGLSILLKALAVCGLPFPLKEAMPWKCIEGKVFHFCYNELKISLNPNKSAEDFCDSNAEAINEFHNTYRVVTVGTRYDRRSF